MPGLDPGIHVLAATQAVNDRDEPGRDGMMRPSGQRDCTRVTVEFLGSVSLPVASVMICVTRSRT